MSAKQFVIWDHEARDAMLEQLARMPVDQLRPRVVTVSHVRESVTHRQRSYYRGVVLPRISDATGYPPDEMHELLRELFGQRAEFVIGDKVYSASTFSTGDAGDKQTMKAFLDMVIRWASTELGLVIPEPDSEREEPPRRAPRRVAA